jgi:para-nitrobenzyl esterase
VDLPLQAMARSGASDLYAYRFDWADEPTLLGSDGAKVFGAAHGLDVPFVFGHFDLGPAGRALFSDDTRASRLALSDAMRRYWATFARTGRPGSSPVSWTPRTATSDGASSMLVLDSTRGRGIRMEEEALSPEQVLAELDADPRLATRAEKCAVRERMVSLGWLTPADAARDGGMGCEGL